MVLFDEVYEEVNCICSGSEAEERLGLPSGLIGEDVTVSITSEITDSGTIYTVEETCEQSDKLRHVVMLACVLSIILGLGYLIGVLLTVCGIF